MPDLFNPLTLLISGFKPTYTNLVQGIINSRVLAAGYSTQTDVATTGTTNNYAVPQTFEIYWTGASAWTLTGMVPSQDGDIRVFHNGSSGQSMWFKHQNTGSTAANRFITDSLNGQIIGPGGSIGWRYNGTLDRWTILYFNPGAPITPGYAGTDYTANNSMTWTVEAADVATCQFVQYGKRLFFDFVFSNTAVGGTPSTALQRVIPGGFTATKNQVIPIRVLDAGTSEAGLAFVVGGGSVTIQFYRISAANWSAAANTTGVHGNIAIDVD